MASIPLPALHLQAPAPPENPLDQYARLMQLKNQMANAPLQRQALQQQVQAGQLENQKAQIGLKDQQAMTAAMQQWAQPKPATAPANVPQGMTGGPPAQAPASTMPSYDDLIDLAKKNGASFSAIQGLQKSVLDMKEKAATIAKDDAQTGQDKASAIKTKNGMLIDAMTGITSLPDDQLAPGLLSAAQELSQKGLLDPEHVQMAQQLAQSGDPATIRRQLGIQIAGMGGFSKMIEDAQKKTDLQKKQQESDWYAQNGGAPGVPIEAVQQSDWLKKNPGKGPSDFVAWKAKQAPLAQFNMMNNTGSGQPAADVAKKFGYSPEAFDQAAERFAATGALPPTGRGGAALAANKAIMNRAAELHGGESIAANSAEYKANSESLKKLTAFNDNVTAFEQTASKNFDLLQGTLKDIPDLGAKFANVPARMISSSMIGTDAMAKFHTALNVAQTEAAKVLNNPNSSAVLSDSARGDLQKIIDGNLPVSAIVASLDTLRKDMKNRLESNQETIANIKQRLGNASGSQATPQAPGGSDPFAQFGGKAH